MNEAYYININEGINRKLINTLMVLTEDPISILIDFDVEHFLWFESGACFFFTNRRLKHHIMRTTDRNYIPATTEDLQDLVKDVRKGRIELY